ncbi:MAG TPA: hypothetical protein VL500_07085 [Candidatus Eisenbacteria bacterium]|nr:hypothetical protein [Candidatus Eisenbacteria bacterium]
MIRIHDLTTGFDGLNVPGIPFYADRALVLRGTAIVSAGPIDEHLAYLKDVDIGANEVVRLDTGRLVADLAAREDARRIVVERARSGSLLQFFSVTGHEERLLDSLGLDWSHTFSAPAAITREANDKAALRRLGERLGSPHVFPRHRVCRPSDTGRVYGMVGELMRSDADFVVLKRPDLASGDGMKLVERCRDWLRHVDPYLAHHAGAAEIIVEAGYEHVPMSVQWELGHDGPSFACATAQLIDESFTHSGNILSSGELPDVTAADVADMRRMSEPFVRHYWDQGFRGICGFDFLRSKDGRRFMLECNGRVTATTYANGIAREVARRTPDWSLVMSNVPASPAVRSFADVRDRLGRRLFDGTKGVLPFNLRCLSLENPKIAVAVVGADVLEAKIILNDVVRCLA